MTEAPGTKKTVLLMDSFAITREQTAGSLHGYKVIESSSVKPREGSVSVEEIIDQIHIDLVIIVFRIPVDLVVARELHGKGKKVIVCTILPLTIKEGLIPIPYNDTDALVKAVTTLLTSDNNH